MHPTMNALRPTLTPMPLLATLAAVALAACGDAPAPVAADPFASTAVVSAPRLRALATDDGSTRASVYDFASGALTLRQLAVAGRTTCYDVSLATVSTAPVRSQGGWAPSRDATRGKPRVPRRLPHRGITWQVLVPHRGPPSRAAG